MEVRLSEELDQTMIVRIVGRTILAILQHGHTEIPEEIERETPSPL